MATTITGKLNKDAKQFAAGEYTGFNVRIGVKYYDRQTKENQWTNYSAVIFSNNQAQISFLQSALIEGSIVEVQGESIKVDTFTKDDGQTLITLELNNARLGYIGTPGQAQQSAAPQQSAQGFAPVAPVNPDRIHNNKTWTHTALLAEGATEAQIFMLPVAEEWPF